MNDTLRLRTAEVIAVGSELLGSTRLDTNSLYLSGKLAALGIELRSKTVVGDNRREVATLVRQALERADFIILTGGLGPTDDDVTRDAVADALGVSMHEDPQIVESLKRRFAKRGMEMPAVNRRQAMVLEGAEVLDNPNGSAPGQLLERGNRLIALLPGPPRELQPMMEALAAGPLAARASDERLFRTALFIVGRGESAVEEVVQPIYSKWLQATPPIETTILAAPGQIELHLVMRSGDADQANATLARARDQIVGALGPAVFSIDGRSMEEIVGGLLRERALTIAIAESCTGGLLSSRLTDVPGSSDYVLGGVVAYSNDLKVSFANVPSELIDANGAVSEPVALALAEGIRSSTGASVGVGVTGIAGPGGATPQKPVGTVCVAVVDPAGQSHVRTLSLYGNRAMVKFQAAQLAMDMVRRILTDKS